MQSGELLNVGVTGFSRKPGENKPAQMFFPGEPLNEEDSLFLDLKEASEKASAAVIAESMPATKEIEKSAMLLGGILF